MNITFDCDVCISKFNSVQYTLKTGNIHNSTQWTYHFYSFHQFLISFLIILGKNPFSAKRHSAQKTLSYLITLILAQQILVHRRF